MTNTIAVPAETATDDELGVFHEAIRLKLEARIEDLAAEARDAEEQAARARNELRRIKANVKAEQWYNLYSVLTSAEVESLCNISPTDLLSHD